MATSGERGALRRPAVVAWLRLARVYQRIERDSERWLEPWDLSLAQFDVLAQVGASEGMSQQELAEALLVTKGNVSQLVAKMERRGLLTRSQEGRTLCLALTPEGRALHDRVVPAHERWLAERLGALSREQLGRLAGLLRTLDHATP
ncbi:MAG TPA: MarR family transcriptional regulator [Ktedonobacterales bacterium]|nr:MarR family transcriptional regulator [Ktedonobacterales bacterium]